MLNSVVVSGFTEVSVNIQVSKMKCAVFTLSSPCASWLCWDALVLLDSYLLSFFFFGLEMGMVNYQDKCTWQFNSPSSVRLCMHVCACPCAW